FHVTGVQTCALPISLRRLGRGARDRPAPPGGADPHLEPGPAPPFRSVPAGGSLEHPPAPLPHAGTERGLQPDRSAPGGSLLQPRSEERRVGNDAMTL